MSKRKPNKPKRSRKRKQQAQTQQAATKKSEPVNEKKQVSPWVAGLILAPFLAIAAYAGFQLLTAGDVNTDPVDDNPAVSKTDNNETAAPERAGGQAVGKWQTGESLAEKWNRIDDPSGDGWNTEAFNQRVTGQLAEIKKQLSKPSKISADSLRSLSTTEVSVGSLRPENPELAWSADGLGVYRSQQQTGQDLKQTDRAAFAKSLTALVKKFTDPENLRAKIKVFRIKENTDFTETWQTVELFGKTEQGLEEENMVWYAKWKLDESGRSPQIAHLEFENYEGIVREGNQLFSDCTESIFANNDRFQNQLLVGYNQLLQRCQVNDYYVTLGNPGLTLGDVNNDGLDDLFICQENGAPNMLFIQNADGSLRDFTDESGANWLQNCRSSLIVDLDNDGNNDLVVAYTGGVVVASGDGSGKFKVQKYLETGADILVLNSADYDLDGRLDLFVGVYGADEAILQQQQLAGAGAGGSDFVYVDAKDGGGNTLFRNECGDGLWQFSDVTESTGLSENNHRYSQAGAWADFDNDGDPDLYVANDFGPNNLFRNDVDENGKRTFVDIAKSADAQDSASGMSVDWADFDRNGFLDIYVGNMYSYAGNRIAFQNQFKPNQSGDVKASYQRFARGNTLLRNQGTSGSGDEPGNDFSFADDSLIAAVNRGRWAWGSRFADLNNDGWQDMVVANGFITAEDSGDL
jgi:hypothetical protein